MRRRHLIGLAALVVLLAVGAFAGARVGGEPTVATHTETFEHVVTYTIPTETVTTVETVTVTAPTTTAPPPTTTTEPPPDEVTCLVSNRADWELAGTDCAYGTLIEQTNGQWQCNQPLSSFGPLPVKVVHTYTGLVNTGDQGGMDIVSGCRGDADSDTIDLIYQSNANGSDLGSCGGGGKFRTAPGPRDMQVTGNFDGGAVCGGAHQDGLQMHPAMPDANLDVVNGTSGDWDAGTSTVVGAGGSIFFSYEVDLDVYGGEYVSCNHGYFGDSTPSNVVSGAKFRTGRTDGTDPKCAPYFPSDPCVGLATFANVTCERWIGGAWVSRPPRT